VPVWHLPAGHPPGAVGACHFGDAASTRLPLPLANNSPPARWQFSVHLCHRASGRPGRPSLRPDPVTPQRLAGPVAPPLGRAGGPEKWHKVAGSGAFFEHPYTV
jgi:hypothetical protein